MGSSGREPDPVATDSTIGNRTPPRAVLLGKPGAMSASVMTGIYQRSAPNKIPQLSESFPKPRESLSPCSENCGPDSRFWFHGFSTHVAGGDAPSRCRRQDRCPNAAPETSPPHDVDARPLRPHRFQFTFTPKHGSWLNLVEGFFSKLAPPSGSAIQSAGERTRLKPVDLALCSDHARFLKRLVEVGLCRPLRKSAYRIALAV